MVDKVRYGWSPFELNYNGAKIFKIRYTTPSGSMTASRRFPEPSVAAACFIKSCWCEPSGMFFLGLNVFEDLLPKFNDGKKLIILSSLKIKWPGSCLSVFCVLKKVWNYQLIYCTFSGNMFRKSYCQSQLGLKTII